MSRGAKPSIARKRWFEVRQMRETGMSIKELCKWFRDEKTDRPVHPATIFKILAYCRKQIGTAEKLPKPRRARAHLYGPKDRPNSTMS